jgi:radical SAM superfamily enzyme YgiQ (UPF0313 family)
MRKLLLVLPRNERGYWNKVSKSGKAGFVRLSLPVIAALTPSHWEVEILDSRAEKVDYGRKADLVGITAFTAEIPSAYEIADGFLARGVPVVLGGIHVTFMPDEALAHAAAVVVGEAENLWADVIADAEKGELKRVYKSDKPVTMENMPVPRRDLLNRKMYVSGFNTVNASRGCPNNCHYCAVTEFFGNKYKTRNVDDVISEIQGLDSTDIFFVDDNITGKPEYAKELFRRLIPLKRAWGGQTTINTAKDKELLDLYAKSGGKYAFIGFETLSKKNLKTMRKSWNTPENYKAAIKTIHGAGINILASFIFGMDDDTKDVFKETVDFIMESGLDAAQFHILTPFPGTRLYAEMDKAGRIVNKDWAKYHTGEVIFKPLGMTAEELQNGYYWAFRETYSIPNIVKRCLRIRKGLVYRIGMNIAYRKKAMRMPLVSI